MNGSYNNHRREDPPLERIVLLGFMCSGKSTVGAAIARRLEWDFVDFDVEIEGREGAGIRRIVEERGEGYLRKLERALTEEVASARQLVLAPGGGWITDPDLLQMLRPGALAVWLRVSPEETARRLKEDPIDRPFRDLDDPVPQIGDMMAEREPLYRRADMVIPAGSRTSEELAFEVELLVRNRGVARPGG